jgi:ABC-type glycerol-3-phosphate transport system substrate-binding protein
VAPSRFYHDLRDKHHVMPTPAEQANMIAQGGWGGGSINLFATKRFAMLMFGRYGRINWRIMNRKAVERGQGLPLSIDFAPQPKGQRRWYVGGSRMAVINAHSPRRFESLDFLHYLAGPVYGRQINWSADCIPGPRKWSQTPEQLSNPDFPNEHGTDHYWRDEADDVHQLPHSPFLPFQKVMEVVNYHQDRMSSHLCPVEEGVARIEIDLNREMERYLDEHKYLREAYDAALVRQREIDATKED